MNKFKILGSIPTLSLLLVTTLNIDNADSNEDNPVPFSPPFQHSILPQQSQPQHQQHINQQPLNSNEPSYGHKNQFDSHSSSVTSVMPF
jgi:hypothetical protein